ncbi:MAG: hypothetical protein K2Z81_23440, partial [Cyanobacteria bacterium]|nr:hypothetical protein [Cyanobacteriota bacterium]
MNINEFLCKHDDSKIKVIAGDLPEGFWELHDSVLDRVGVTASDELGSLDLSTELKSVQMKNHINRDSVEPLVGAGVGALIGLNMGRFLGLAAPLGAAGGALAGHFLTKHNPEVSVSV